MGGEGIQDLASRLSSESLTNIQNKIGGAPDSWSVDEIGDGNVNLIFRLKGLNGQVLVKQAVPYLRCVGESWPLSLKRNYFEFHALREHSEVASDYLPRVFAFDEESAAMVMEFLGDHIILRKGMMQALKYPHFSEHIADYMAKSLFFTSDLYLSAGKKKEKMQRFCGNVDLCKITEDLIFTDPYRCSTQNRWTPELKNKVKALQRDVELKVAVTEMKAKFLTSTQALIHGDLHTGSIMVNGNETKVIDPEFAFYGPMGFDVGLLLANFWMSYFSQEGLTSEPDARAHYEEWILEQIATIWNKFSSKFTGFWRTHLHGDYISKNLIQEEGGLEVVARIQSRFMSELFRDMLRFAGAEMIRRTVGLAHVADFDSISDSHKRALSEARNLEMARFLLVGQPECTNVEDALNLSRRVRASTPEL